jgi:hypothetical protein
MCQPTPPNGQYATQTHWRVDESPRLGKQHIRRFSSCQRGGRGVRRCQTPAFFTVGQVPGVTDHAAGYLELAARGLRTVFVSLPDLAGPDDLARCIALLHPELRSGEQVDGERHHLARRLRPTAPTQP